MRRKNTKRKLLAFLSASVLLFQGNILHAEAADGILTIDQEYVDTYGSEIVVQDGVQRVIVEDGVNVDIALYNVSIDDSGSQTQGSPVVIRDRSYVTLSLVGSSDLKAGYNQYHVGYAGIYVEEGSTLVIEGPGSLNAEGGVYGTESSSIGGAGIGGGAADDTVPVPPALAEDATGHPWEAS